MKRDNAGKKYDEEAMLEAVCHELMRAAVLEKLENETDSGSALIRGVAAVGNPLGFPGRAHRREIVLDPEVESFGSREITVHAHPGEAVTESPEDVLLYLETRRRRRPARHYIADGIDVREVDPFPSPDEDPYE